MRTVFTKCDSCREVIAGQPSATIEFGWQSKVEPAHFCERCAPKLITALTEGRESVAAFLRGKAFGPRPQADGDAGEPVNAS